MAIVVTHTVRPLSDIKLSSPELATAIGDYVVTTIRRRTEAGRDASGSAFVPLSAGYAKQKREALGHARADLTVSGRMLNDMRARTVNYHQVEVLFGSRGGSSSGSTFVQRSRSMGAADKAFFHNISGAGKSRTKREFFELSAAEIDEITRRVDAYLARQLA